MVRITVHFNLIEKGIDNAENFIKKYKIHNARLWDLYRENKINKEALRSKRFLMALAEYGIDDKDLAKQFGLAYIKQSPLKTKLSPFTHEVLSYLKNK